MAEFAYPPTENTKYEYPCHTADSQPVKTAINKKAVVPIKIRCGKSTMNDLGRSRLMPKTCTPAGNLTAAQNPAAMDKLTEAIPANSDSHHGHFSGACSLWKLQPLSSPAHGQLQPQSKSQPQTGVTTSMAITTVKIPDKALIFFNLCK